MDGEEGPYGIVEYQLSSQDSSPNYNHFAVNRSTGEITVRHTLDFLIQPTYRLALYYNITISF